MSANPEFRQTISKYASLRCDACGTPLMRNGQCLRTYEQLWGFRRSEKLVRGHSSFSLSIFPVVCSEACRAFVTADPTWPENKGVETDQRTRRWHCKKGHHHEHTFSSRGGEPPSWMPALRAEP